jgi:hypothetical protein
VNTLATVIDHVAYDSFGRIANETTPVNGDRYKFAGREFDTSRSLYFVGVGGFDASTGRFFSRPPLGHYQEASSRIIVKANRPTANDQHSNDSARRGEDSRETGSRLATNEWYSIGGGVLGTAVGVGVGYGGAVFLLGMFPPVALTVGAIGVGILVGGCFTSLSTLYVHQCNESGIPLSNSGAFWTSFGAASISSAIATFAITWGQAPIGPGSTFNSWGSWTPFSTGGTYAQAMGGFIPASGASASGSTIVNGAASTASAAAAIYLTNPSTISNSSTSHGLEGPSAPIDGTIDPRLIDYQTSKSYCFGPWGDIGIGTTDTIVSHRDFIQYQYRQSSQS